MISIVALLITLLTSFSWHSGRIISNETDPSNLQNQPPEVIIESPVEGQSILPGQQINYSVTVHDLEDGSTKYQEIADNEIFIELKYFSSSSPPSSSQHQSQLESTGLQLIKKTACFDCHRWKTGLVGPSFQEIAKRYDQHESSELVTSIIMGSSNKWGSELMPSQQTLNQAQAHQIVSWLLTHGKEPTLEIKRGAKGNISVDPSAKTGYLIITAAYTDHGSTEGDHRLTGTARLVIKINPN